MVDKITQFAVELKDPNTDLKERLFALKFLLHFVGDLHQPLHCADNNDRDGNSVKVLADGIGSRPLPLHDLWDTQFVDAIARPPAALAQFLRMQITPDHAANWATGTPEDWAWEAFAMAQEGAFGDPPLSGTQHVDAPYVERAKIDVALQLSRAGVRLAHVLNDALRQRLP